MAGGADVDVPVTPGYPHHIRHPGPAAQSGNNPQLGEVHGHFVKMDRMADVHGEVGTVGHCGVDENGDIQLYSLGIQRIELLVVGPDAEPEGRGVEALQTKMYRDTGFIAPAGYPDYDTATEADREYAFIGRASDNKIYDGSTYVEGKYIW